MKHTIKINENKLKHFIKKRLDEIENRFSINDEYTIVEWVEDLFGGNNDVLENDTKTDCIIIGFLGNTLCEALYEKKSNSVEVSLINAPNHPINIENKNIILNKIQSTNNDYKTDIHIEFDDLGNKVLLHFYKKDRGGSVLYKGDNSDDFTS